MDNLKAIYGIGTVTERKLQDAGYESYEKIASTTAVDLSESVGLTETTAGRIIQSARTLLEPELVEQLDESGSPAESPETIAEDSESEAPQPDKAQLANQLVNAILENPDAVQQIAQEVSLELAQVLGKKLRTKLAKKVLNKKKYRKALISELIKELKSL